MYSKRIHIFVIFLVFLSSAILTGCATGETSQETVVVTEDPMEEPVEEEQVEVEITPTAAAPDSTPEVVTTSPTIKETRRLTLEWPPTMRMGDADIIRVTLEMDENGEITRETGQDGEEIVEDEEVNRNEG